MADFSSLDNIIDSVCNLGQTFDGVIRKTGTAPEAIGVWHSYWRGAGLPGAGSDGAAVSASANSGGTAMTNAGLWFPDQSGKVKRLLSADAYATQDCTLVVLDRLVSASALNLVGTGTKNVNTVALPTRASGGASVMGFLEVTTVTATNAVVGTASYTDQSGNNGSTSQAFTFPALATNVDTLIPILFADGDTGMRSIETLNITTASGGSGACNVVLAREICRIPLDANNGTSRSWLSQMGNMPRIYDGASLMIAIIAGSVTAASIEGHIYGAYR